MFEKGYTGYNGRNDKKASSIGLYLCRRICKNLNHVISVDSSLDSGTGGANPLGTGEIRGRSSKKTLDFCRGV